MRMAYNACMGRARCMALSCVFTGLAVGLLLAAAGCRKQAHLPDTGGVSGQPARDEILTGLEGKLPDEQQFALLFITRFKLPGYEQPLRKLARDNPIAGVALACVYRNPQPLLDWRKRQPDQAAARNAVLGAVYGLGCAADVPAGLWDAVIEQTAPAARSELLWGLAQLSLEQAATLALSPGIQRELEAEQASVGPTLSLEQRAAYDALLGGAPEHAIAWQDYIAQAGSLQLTGTQWAALLRWAEPQQVRQVLDAAKADGQTCAALATALALHARNDVTLPWTREQCRLAGVEVEYIACRLDTPQQQTAAIQLFDALAPPGAKEPEQQSANAPAQVEADAEQQSRALQLLSYAAMRHDAEAVAYVLSLAPQMEPQLLGAVLATVERYDRSLVTEAQLKALGELASPDAAYWMLLGWPESQAVRNSRMAALVRVTPGQENAMLVYAYRLYQARQAADAG